MGQETCVAVFRFLCALFLLVAVIALVTDLSAFTAGQPFSITTVAAQWREMAPATLQSTAAFIQKATAPWVWTWVLSPVLALPTFLMFGLLALWTGYLGRRRHRVNIYVN